MITKSDVHEIKTFGYAILGCVSVVDNPTTVDFVIIVALSVLVVFHAFQAINYVFQGE